jgi:predicted O-methyltransferase YrrM
MLLLHKFRQRAFRNKDSPFELAAVDFEGTALSRLPDAIKKRVGRWFRVSGRTLDNLFRPDMTAIWLARSLYGKSMLHIDALLALYECASRCRGAIVEIGAFVGAGTIMMASAMMRAGNTAPVIAIEVGGVKEHPLMPSDDILKDLRANLAEHGLAHRVSIVEGWSNMVSNQVASLLGDDKIGLLAIDADGEIERDLEIYRKWLAPNAMIVIDDYIVVEENVKAAVVYAGVEHLVAKGMLRKSKIVPWGTWFGRYRG